MSHDYKNRIAVSSRYRRSSFFSHKPNDPGASVHSSLRQSENNTKTAKLFSTHIAPEFLKVAELISERFGKNVYLIGIRSVYEQGVKPWRVTEDYDVYSPLTKEQRDELSEEIKKRFGGSYQWTSFGIIYRVGKEEIDINFTNPIPDEPLRKRAKRITSNIYAVSIEDLIIMKLTSNRRKDRIDAGKILRNTLGKYNRDLLAAEAEKAGVSKELLKTAKRYEIKLPPYQLEK